VDRHKRAQAPREGDQVSPNRREGWTARDGEGWLDGVRLVDCHKNGPLDGTTRLAAGEQASSTQAVTVETRHPFCLLGIVWIAPGTKCSYYDEHMCFGLSGR